MNETYFLSGEYGLIALEDESLPVYLSRVSSDLNGAMFSLAGADADHFSIDSVSGSVFFNEDVLTTFGDSFALTIKADNDGVSSDKPIEILVLKEGIQRAIFSDEEKISGSPYDEVFLDLGERIINSITFNVFSAVIMPSSVS